MNELREEILEHLSEALSDLFSVRDWLVKADRCCKMGLEMETGNAIAIAGVRLDRGIRLVEIVKKMLEEVR